MSEHGGNAPFLEIVYSSGVSAPVASFTKDKTTGCYPTTVTFTDTSTNTPTSWLWVFGDSSVENNTVQNPVHTFSTAGTYNVNLTATNAGGSNTSATQAVVVTDCTAPASITSFSQNKNTCTEQTVTWTNPVDADFASVMLYQDNVWHVNETGTSHAFTGLNSWQSYIYSTKTQDATGNINATWVNQTVTTSPVCKIITYIRQFYLLEGVI